MALAACLLVSGLARAASTTAAPIGIVAAENFYGDIARQVGGRVAMDGATETEPTGMECEAGC